jgi:hypothetical protein
LKQQARGASEMMALEPGAVVNITNTINASATRVSVSAG